MRAAGVLCLICLGCHAVLSTPTEPVDMAPTTAQVGSQIKAPPRAKVAIQPGASGSSATEVPDRNHLRLAAACMTQGADDQACRHLGAFLDANPEHRNGRALYAELLYKRGQLGEARDQFLRLLAVLQDESGHDARQMVHCHGRLLALAEAAGDAYGADLERGLGFYWLALARRELGEPEGDLPVEALLCRSAGLLSSAHAQRPEAARPCWYLHLVWRKLGQSQPAQHWLSRAQAAAPFSDLSATEARGLHIACQADAMRGFP